MQIYYNILYYVRIECKVYTVYSEMILMRKILCYSDFIISPLSLYIACNALCVS